MTKLSPLSLSSEGVTRCCLFCCKIYRDNSQKQASANLDNREVLERRFIRLLESYCSLSTRLQQFPHRYLLDVPENLMSLSRSSVLGPSGGDGALFRSCGECCQVISTTCTAIHRVKVAELEADWRLRKLTEWMRSEEEVPGRRENFEVFIQAYQSDSSASGVEPNAIREHLLETCSRKLKYYDTPRIFLQRCKLPQKEKEARHQERFSEEVCGTSIGEDDADGSSMEDEWVPVPNSGSDNESEFVPSDVDLEEQESQSDEHLITAPLPSECNNDNDPEFVPKRTSRSGRALKRRLPNTEYLSSDPDTDNCSGPRENEKKLKKTVSSKKFCDRGKKFECDICSKFLASATTLERHKRQHTGDKRYRCPHCSNAVMFINGSHLDFHIFNHHKDKLLGEFKEATTSDAQFAKIISTVLRKLSQAKKCILCDSTKQKQYGRNHDIERHLIQDHSETLVAELKRFQEDPRLMPVILKEELCSQLEEPSVCHICSKLLKHKHSLKCHMTACHGDELSESGKPYSSNVCPHCSKRLPNKSKLLIHCIRFHRLETFAPYRLEGTNDNGFSEAIEAALERLIVDNMKCNLCDKLFGSKVRCTKHSMDYHAGKLETELKSSQNYLYEEVEEEDLNEAIASSSEHKCKYCSHHAKKPSGRKLHELNCHPAKALSQFRLKNTSLDVFEEGIKDVFRSMIFKNNCQICEKKYTSFTCKQHILQEHRERFKREILSYQEKAAVALARPLVASEENAEAIVSDEETVTKVKQEVQLS